jgi:ABC-type Fe3+/spermidine/putrescine transport system ATPase subunit
MIRVEHLSVRFGTFRLRDIHLEVREGECFVLLGPSGAGKTLLLETIMGLKRPERGRVLLDGRDITRLPPEQRGIGYVPQDLALFPHLSVRENILFGPKVRGLPREEAERELERLATLLNLHPFLERRDVLSLSGGEKQRVALARALIVRPRVLFLDEPFAALDEAIRRELQIQFRTLQRTLGVTLFQVTHLHEEAFLMADRLGILMEGRLEQVGTPEEIHRCPANLRVARFLLMNNLFEARVERWEGRRAVCSLGPLRVEVETERPLQPGQVLRLGIWPEEIWMARTDRPPSAHRQVNLVSGYVEDILNLGTHQRVRVRVPDRHGLPLEVALSHLAFRATRPRIGGSVRLQLPPHAFCIFPEED